MKLSVVIVNYNVKHFLEQALLSVKKALQQTEGEIWVVDNCSVDGSVEMVREKFPEVHLIENTKNVGFSRANNQAIEQSEAEYILLLNPDTVVEEDTFKKVCDFMDAHPEAGGLGVKMIDGTGTFLPESKRGLPTPQVAFYKMSGLSKIFPRSKAFGRYHLGFLDKDKIHEVDVLSGAFMLLRRSVLDKTGLLDETFFMYGEDIDLSYRITKAGYKNYYFPETTIIHYKGESTKKTSVNYVFVFYKAMVIFARKHYSASYARSFGLFIHTAIWFRAFIALAHRFVLKAWQPALDLLILFVSSYLLKMYWEENHKLVKGGEYPVKYLLINLPVYLCCWIAGMYSAGVYGRNAPLRRIVFGMFSGTIAIAVLYAFAPESLRFSRALIILGALSGTALLMLYRLGIYFYRHRSFNYGEGQAYNTIIIGMPEEALRVRRLLNESQVPHTFLGYVSPPGRKTTAGEYIGTAAQLAEIIQVFKITEVIFCAKDIPSSEIIRWMSVPDQETVNYKIVPEESLYIIGSNSKNTNGEFYSIRLSMNLSSKAVQKRKRLLDIGCSLLFCAMSPFLLFLVKKKKGFIKNIFLVLSGRKTWVGYIPGDEESGTLPELAGGVLNPAGTARAGDLSISASIINFRYARDYSLSHDLHLLLSQLHNLGN